jgi:hypothetical protein
MMVFFVLAEMRLQAVDAIGQQRDLDFWRAGIGGIALKIPHDLRLLFGIKGHVKLQFKFN